ncbi:MAG: DNA primase, partial [Candidatus Latescibacteria bacterium]|nr:DNA primase [Candidatus Latescibacterota bacterium]
ARKYYCHLLQNDPSGATAREYLERRGLSQETMTSFSLGYAPNTWDGLIQVAGRRGFGTDVLERAGLVLPRQDGSGHYDRFRHRIVFPIQAHTGRTVAFGARALDPNERAKYLNSPETPVYHKSAVLYGLWENRSAIRSEGNAVVVEGYMDLIALVQAGIQNVVASSGTALTPQHARLLNRFAQRAVLVFDGDAAGTEAAVRGVGALFEAGSETRVVSLPEGHDPDSYVREHGRDAFQTLTGEAQPVLDFVLDWLRGREDLTSSDGRARATEFIADFIARASDDARRRFLIQDTAEKLRIDEATVVQVVQRIRRSNARRVGRLAPEEEAPAEVFDPRPRWERELLLRMMAEEDIADVLLVQIRPEDFSNTAYRRIAGLIAKRRHEGQSAAVDRLIDGCEDAGLAQILSTLSMEVGISDPDTPQPPLQAYIDTFRIKSLDAQIETLEAELKAASGEDVRELMERHRVLTEQRKELAQKRTTDL